MKAWQLSRYGEPEDVLELAEVPAPGPGPGQLLVRVLAAAANFPDVLLCQGTYQVRPPLPFTPGVELCGEVVETGPERDRVRRRRPGDRRCGAAARRVRRVRPHGRGARVSRARGLDDAEAAPFLVTLPDRMVRAAPAGAAAGGRDAAGARGGRRRRQRRGPARQGGGRAGHRRGRRPGEGGGGQRTRRGRGGGPLRGGLRRGRQGGHRRQGRRRRLRLGGRRRVPQVHQVHRVRGPDRGRRLRER